MLSLSPPPPSPLSGTRASIAVGFDKPLLADGAPKQRKMPNIVGIPFSILQYAVTPTVAHRLKRIFVLSKSVSG